MYWQVYYYDVHTDTKQRFSELLSVHIYSVQKAYLKVNLAHLRSSYLLANCINLQDSGILFAADYDVTKGHIGDYSKYSFILSMNILVLY